jgi:hypothetical protein
MENNPLFEGPNLDYKNQHFLWLFSIGSLYLPSHCLGLCQTTHTAETAKLLSSSRKNPGWIGTAVLNDKKMRGLLQTVTIGRTHLSFFWATIVLYWLTAFNPVGGSG